MHVKNHRFVLASTTAVVFAAAVPALAAGTSPGRAIESNTVTLKSGSVKKVVIDAEIPHASKKVTVFLLAKRSSGDKTLAKTAVTPGNLVSDLNSATMKLKIIRTTATSGTGTLELVGPKNASQPDVASYKLNWSVGKKPAIKATAVPS